LVVVELLPSFDELRSHWSYDQRQQKPDDENVHGVLLFALRDSLRHVVTIRTRLFSVNIKVDLCGNTTGVKKPS
jgi:hypothetical protein